MGSSLRSLTHPTFLLVNDRSGKPAKADNSAVFVESCFSLLSGGNDYRITRKHEIADWDRLTDSLNIRRPQRRGFAIPLLKDDDLIDA